MYWKDRAVLVRMEKTVNDGGYKTVRAVRYPVFVNRKSAARSEFYAARQAGERITLVLEVRAADYHEETRVEFGGRYYEVVRAYTQNGETYELNCKETGEMEEEACGPEQHPDGGAVDGRAH